MAARRRLRPCRHPCLFRHACAGARRRFRRPVAGAGRGARPDHRDPRRSFGAKRGGLLVRVRLCDRRSGPVCAGAALRKIAATRGGDRDRLCGVGVDRGAGARPRTAGRGAHQAASHRLDPHRHAAGGRSHRVLYAAIGAVHLIFRQPLLEVSFHPLLAAALRRNVLFWDVVFYGSSRWW